MSKEFDQAVKKARKALKDKDKDAFLKALLDIDTLIETLSLGDREIIEEQDIIFGAVEQRMFRDGEHLAENLAELRRKQEGIKDYKRTYKNLKKNLNDALRFEDQESFFQYLFEFEDLLKEVGLPEVLRSDGMKYWDEITKKADDAGWLGKKEKEKREARPSQWEKREAEIRRLEEKGVPREKAIEHVDARILKRAGMTMCPICGNVINLKAEEYSVVGGIAYHVHCLKKKKEKEKERLAQIPFMMLDTEVHCDYCKKPIFKGDIIAFEAPKGVDFTTSLETKWFHNSEELRCYEKWLEERGKKK